MERLNECEKFEQVSSVSTSNDIILNSKDLIKNNNNSANLNSSNLNNSTSNKNLIKYKKPSISLTSQSTMNLTNNIFKSSQEFSKKISKEVAQKSFNRSISSTSDYSSSTSSEPQTDLETKIPIESELVVPIPVIQKPDGCLRVKTLCLVGALLPGLGCYICIAYTYLFQLDRVMNFTSIDCNGLKRYVNYT